MKNSLRLVGNRYPAAELCLTFFAALTFSLASVWAYAEPTKLMTLQTVDVDGKSTKIIEETDSPGTVAKSISIGEEIRLSKILTSAKTVITVRSLNHNVIQLNGESQITAPIVHRAGERYNLKRGSADFDVTAPLSFFQVEIDSVTVSARDAKFHLERVAGADGDVIHVDVLRGEVSVARPFEINIANVAAKPIVDMSESLAITQSGASNSQFSSKRPTPIKFESTNAAELFFKNSVGVAVKSTEPDKIRDALLSRASFFSGLNKHKEAIESLNSARQFTVSNNYALYSIMIKLGKEYSSLGDASTALPYFENALFLAENGYSGSATPLYRLLADSYTKLQDAPAAARYSAFAEASSFKTSKTSLNTYKFPSVLKRPPPEFPTSMRKRGLDGEVVLKGVMTPEGKYEYIQVIKAAHPAFEKAAVSAMFGISIEPATLDGKPIPQVAQVPFNFLLTDVGRYARPEVDPDRSAYYFPKALPEQYDFAPVVRILSLPTYPYDLALDDQTGSAVVTVTIDATGEVRDAKVVEASQPAFGESLKAMIQNWKIEPALKNGRPISVQFKNKHRFNSEEWSNIINKETSALKTNIKSHPERIFSFDQLDSVPKLLYQPQPVDTRSASAVSATPDKIKIEFFIDREGSVQLPRTISATNTDLAWSIMTVMNRWIFEVPKVKGEPVFARRQMIFEYP